MEISAIGIKKLYRFQFEFLNLKNGKGNITGNKLDYVKSI